MSENYDLTIEGPGKCKSSGRFVGFVSSYSDICPTSCSRVTAKRPPGLVLFLGTVCMRARMHVHSSKCIGESLGQGVQRPVALL